MWFWKKPDWKTNQPTNKKYVLEDTMPIENENRQNWLGQWLGQWLPWEEKVMGKESGNILCLDFCASYKFTFTAPWISSSYTPYLFSFFLPLLPLPPPPPPPLPRTGGDVNARAHHLMALFVSTCWQPKMNLGLDCIDSSGHLPVISFFGASLDDLKQNYF